MTELLPLIKLVALAIMVIMGCANIVVGTGRKDYSQACFGALIWIVVL